MREPVGHDPPEDGDGHRHSVQDRLHHEYQDALSLGIPEQIILDFDRALDAYLSAWTLAIKRAVRAPKHAAQRARDA